MASCCLSPKPCCSVIFFPQSNIWLDDFPQDTVYSFKVMRFYDAKELFFSKTLSVFLITGNTLSVSVTEAVITKSIKDRQLLSLDNLPPISHDRLSVVLCNIFILLPLTNTSLFPDELSSTKHLIGYEWLHHQANDFISSLQPFVSRKLLAQLIHLFPLKVA